jgi:glycosyltransferase involved in cell wall biosynthesis
VGAIGPEKGFDVLLACARDAALRELPITFTVVGFTTDDVRLFETGKVFITGRYDEEDCQQLVRSADAQLGFLPSVWPETWCYALSALLEADLDVMSFDIGAQAERILKAKRGFVLPLGSTAHVINDALLSYAASLVL